MQTEKSYHLDRTWQARFLNLRVGMVAIFLISILATGLWPSLVINYLEFGCIWTLFVFFWLTAATWFGWVVDRALLVTSPEGVEYRLPGYRVHTSWQSIVGIQNFRFGFWASQGLVSRQVTVQSGLIGKAYQIIGLAGTAIPLTPFLEQWQQMDLTRYLEPSLLDAVVRKAPSEIDTSAQKVRDEREARVQRVQRQLQRFHRVFMLAFFLLLLIVCSVSFFTSLTR